MITLVSLSYRTLALLPTLGKRSTILELSNKMYDMGYPTLPQGIDTTLNRMCSDGLVEHQVVTSDTTGKPKKVWRLTKKGQTELAKANATLQELLDGSR